MPFARHIPCKPIEKGRFGLVEAPAAGGSVNANDVPPPTRSGFAELWRKLSASGSLLYRAALAWNRDNGMRLSAAVALYTILALSPLLVITIKVLSGDATRAVAAIATRAGIPAGGERRCGDDDRRTKSRQRRAHEVGCIRILEAGDHERRRRQTAR